jgi:hypothetical protein
VIGRITDDDYRRRVRWPTMRRPQVLAVLLVSVLGAILLVGAGASGATVRATAACKSLGPPQLGKPLCDGTATITVGSKKTHYTKVFCLMESNGPVEVFKKQAFVLTTVFGRKLTTTSARIGVAGGSKGSIVAGATVKLRPKTKRREGTFVSAPQKGTPRITGSFRCK